MPRQRNIFTEESHRGRTFLIGLAVALLLLVAALITTNLALNHTVSYQKTYVTISQLPEALENFTILHLSDMNGKSLGENQSALRSALGNVSPSIVVLSGNMVGSSGNVEPVLELVELLPKGTTILLLPGDDDPALYTSKAHGSLSPYADWAQTLIDAGVTILDEPFSVTRSGKTIWFIPEKLYNQDLASSEASWQNQLDELNASITDLTADQAALKRNAEYQLERLARIRDSIASIKATDIQICVTHMPLTRETVTSARENAADGQIFALHRASLVLAGGYCGGQWRIPGVGAIWAPELGFFPADELVQGMSYLNGVQQHISPGLGASELYPVLSWRIFNQPAATLLVLSSSMH